MSRPDKSDLVNEAMRHGVPSYEAWEMTVTELGDFIQSRQSSEPEPEPESEPEPQSQPDETPDGEVA